MEIREAIQTRGHAIGSVDCLKSSSVSPASSSTCPDEMLRPPTAVVVVHTKMPSDYYRHVNTIFCQLAWRELAVRAALRA